MQIEKSSSYNLERNNHDHTVSFFNSGVIFEEEWIEELSGRLHHKGRIEGKIRIYISKGYPRSSFLTRHLARDPD